MKYKFINYVQSGKTVPFKKETNATVAQVDFDVEGVKFVYEFRIYNAGDFNYKYVRYLSNIDENEITKKAVYNNRIKIVMDIEYEVKRYKLMRDQMKLFAV